MAKKKFYETNDFKSLQAEWYGKLSASGFNDIESSESEDVISPQVFSTQEDKFLGLDDRILCELILEADEFENDHERKIFELHTHGRSNREIAKYIDDNLEIFLRKKSYKTIERMINRIKADYVGYK